MTAKRVLAGWLAITIGLGVFVGCSSSRVSFRYPGETLVFPHQGLPPAIYVDLVNDLRSGAQRAGEGSSSDVRFPADEDWDRPVAQIYYEALMQDLTQTNAVAVAAQRDQADYVLTVDLLNLGCAVKRSATGWLASSLLGAGVGYAAGTSIGAAAVGALLGVGAIPVPTRVRAVCEVRLRLAEPGGELVWEEACLGETTDSNLESMTARKDQQWVDEYLTVAVKRCNACLVGQLRHAIHERQSAQLPSRY